MIHIVDATYENGMLKQEQSLPVERTRKGPRHD